MNASIHADLCYICRPNSASGKHLGCDRQGFTRAMPTNSTLAQRSRAGAAVHAPAQPPPPQALLRNRAHIARRGESFVGFSGAPAAPVCFPQKHSGPKFGDGRKCLAVRVPGNQPVSDFHQIQECC
jgi:hypothetical protein